MVVDPITDDETVEVLVDTADGLSWADDLLLGFLFMLRITHVFEEF